jgi:predicted nuclease of predicted toxin-antitoxin system
MQKSFYKHKLLFDENMPQRQSFPRLNELFDVKHIRDDFHQGGVPDSQVYELAIHQQRLIVTYNAKDFIDLAARSSQTGIIALSPSLPLHQIDTKLTALLIRNTSKALCGKFTNLTGETET